MEKKEKDMILAISKLYQSFKTTIPKEVRSIYGLKDGDEIVYRNETDINEIRELITKFGNLIILLPNKKTNSNQRKRFEVKATSIN